MASERWTPKQRLFAAYYVALLNGTDAARLAQYKGDDATLRSIASQNLTKLHIKSFVETALKERVMGADEALARMSDHARADMSDFITVRSGLPFVDLEKANERGKLHLLKRFKNTDKGIEIELYDKQAAITTIGKHHGLWKDGVQININVELVTQVIHAIEDAGLSASDVFNQLLMELDANKQTVSAKDGTGA